MKEKGIRPKTLEVCDFKLSIHINKNVESLNASNAVAVTLYTSGISSKYTNSMPNELKTMWDVVVIGGGPSLA
jgi:tRNA C32,U32 (ribose-2'-O)-methylase TrmJ